MQQAEPECTEHEKFSSVGTQRVYLHSFQRHRTMSDFRLRNFPLLTQHISTSFFHKGRLHSPLHTVGVQLIWTWQIAFHCWFRRLEVSPSSTLTQLMGTRLHISKQWEFLGVTSPFSLKKLGNTRKKEKTKPRWHNAHAKVFLASCCFWQTHKLGIYHFIFFVEYRFSHLDSVSQHCEKHKKQSKVSLSTNERVSD